MKRVIIESPYSGDVKRNKKYLQECLKDSLRRGEAPFASHQMYTTALDDAKDEQRNQGMNAGFAWTAKADLCAIYADYGISAGMREGIKRAAEHGVQIHFRYLFVDNENREVRVDDIPEARSIWKKAYKHHFVNQCDKHFTMLVLGLLGVFAVYSVTHLLKVFLEWMHL